MRKMPSILVSASAALYCGVILPLQTFIPNASNYDFTVSGILPELAAYTLALFVAIYVLLRVSDRFLGSYLTPFFVTVTVFVYLNSGVLSAGIPELAGDLPAMLRNVTRMTIDISAFAAAMLVALVTFRWTRQWLHFVAVGVLVMGLASLADLRTDERDVSERFEGGDLGTFTPASDLAENLEYSPTRNIIMLVLDADPGTVANSFLEQDAALARHFAGFTSYRQNIGMHDRTERGVPGIFTGDYYDETQNMGDYVMTSLGPKTFLRDYSAHGDRIYSMLDFFTYGISNVRIERKPRPESGLKRPYLLRDATEIPHLSLMDTVWFRMVPFIAKGPLLRHDIHTRRVRVNTVGIAFEHVLYPILASRPVASDPRQAFIKFHSHGAHGPFCYELDGSPARRGRTVSEEVRVATSNNLVHVSRLLDALKEKGVYDRSFIVICSDHGNSNGDPFPGDRRASALLMVKPDGAAGSLSMSDDPTGHQNLAKLMKAACGKPLSIEEVTRLLSSERRLYREYDRSARKCYDWVYGPDGAVLSAPGEH